MKRRFKPIISMILLVLLSLCLVSCSSVGIDINDLTPYIGENGNWWVGETDLGVSAQGPQGEQGIQGEQGLPGEDGTDGKDGNTPYIGENGNWWIGDTDLGVSAQGPQGEQGIQGEQGLPGEDGTDGNTPYIGENGNWWVGETDLGVSAQGPQGEQGIQGEQGLPGEDGKDLIATECTVTFIVDEAEYLVSKVNKGDNVNKPLDPTKVGYTFEGWYDDYGDRWSFYGNTVAQNIILTARFTRNEYKVIIDGVEVIYYYGDIITLKDMEDTETEVFVGYFDELGNKYSGDIKIIDNLILTSKFSKKYKITLDLDGGVCESNTVDVVYSRSVELPNPTKDEYIFMGWYINDEIYDDGFIYNFEEDITLKARYISVTSPFLYITTPKGIIVKSYLLNDDVVIIPDTIEEKEVIEVKKTLLEGKTNIKEVVFPKTIVTFEDGILAGQNYLEKITIATDANTTINKLFNVSTSSELPVSFDTIEFNKITNNNQKIFADNTNVYNIILPNYLEKIDCELFYYNINIKTINIPSGVTSIDSHAFSGCTNLTSITISDSITSIDSHAFFECDRLTNVYYNGTIEDWCNIIFNEVFSNPMYYASNFYILDKTSETYNLLTKIEIPETITKIGDYQFCGFINITSITVPSSVTYIERQAFDGCYSLVEVINKSSLNINKGSSENGYIGMYALHIITDENDSKLYTENDFILFKESEEDIKLIKYLGNDKNLVIPNGVTSIGSHAFYNCSSLTSITIPENVTSIGNCAFLNCFGMAEVINKSSINIIKGSTSNGYVGYYALQIIEDEKDSNFYTENNFILYKESEEDIKLIKYLGTDTNVVIPSKVTSIGDGAFYNCSSLTTIIIPNGIISIGDRAFYGCSNLTNIYFENNSQLTSIGKSAFCYCINLTNITIPDSVINIGSFAFDHCTGLANITFGENCQLTSIGNYCFNFCIRLTSITIPASVTSIGEGVFNNCTRLLDVTFAENSQLTSIGSNEFWNCLSLYSIIIPDGVTSIGGNAFYYCMVLTNVTIPSSVKRISGGLFIYCWNLTNITYEGTIDQWNTIEKEYAWDDSTGDYVIHCTDGDISKWIFW